MAAVVAGKSQLLTEAELREGIRRHLKSQGHVEALTAQLRQRLVTEFAVRKAKEVKKTAALEHDDSLLSRVRWSLVVEVLNMYGLRNSLAVFVPECGLGVIEGALVPKELRHIMQCPTPSPGPPGSARLTTLDAVIHQCRKAKSTKDAATETVELALTEIEKNEKSTNAMNLGEALRKMSEAYAHKEIARQAQRAVASRKEEDEKERFENRLKSELARFREIELATERRRLNETHRRELAAVRAEAKAEINQREAAFHKRQSEIERDFSQKLCLAAETAKSERSQLVSALEDIRQREAAAKRAGEIDRRALELHEARLKHQEANLALQIKQLPRPSPSFQVHPPLSQSQVQPQATVQQDLKTQPVARTPITNDLMVATEEHVHTESKDDDSPLEEIPDTVSTTLASPESAQIDQDFAQMLSATPTHDLDEQDQAVPAFLKTETPSQAQASPGAVLQATPGTAATPPRPRTINTAMTPNRRKVQSSTTPSRRHRSEPPENLMAENEALRTEINQLRGLLGQARAALDAFATLPPDRFSQRDLNQSESMPNQSASTKAEAETRHLVTAMLRRHLVGEENADIDTSELHSLVRRKRHSPKDHSLELERQALEHAKKELEIQRQKFEQERSQALTELYTSFKQAAFHPANTHLPPQQPTTIPPYGSQVMAHQVQPLPFYPATTHLPPQQPTTIPQFGSQVMPHPVQPTQDAVDYQQRLDDALAQRLQSEQAERERRLQQLEADELAERQRRLDRLEAAELTERRRRLEQAEATEQQQQFEQEKAAKEKRQSEEEEAAAKRAKLEDEALGQKRRLEQEEAAARKAQLDQEEATAREAQLARDKAAEKRRRSEEEAAAEHKKRVEQEEATKKLQLEQEEATKKQHLEQEEVIKKQQIEQEEATKKLQLEQEEAIKRQQIEQEEAAERERLRKRRAEEEEAARLEEAAAEAKRLQQAAAEAERRQEEEEEQLRLVAEKEKRRIVEEKKQSFTAEQVQLFRKAYEACATTDGLDGSALSTALHKLSGSRPSWQKSEELLSADGPVTNFDHFLTLLASNDSSLYRPPPELDSDALYKKALERAKERRAAETQKEKEEAMQQSVEESPDQLESIASDMSDGLNVESSLDSFEAPPQETSGSSGEGGWSFG